MATYVLVSGEPSGDLLGAALIKALKTRQPQAQIYGVGGQPMVEAGLQQWACSSVLSVMGITAVLRQLPRLLAFRASLVKRIKTLAVECQGRGQSLIFIGIDAPDFNLGLARRLKSGGGVRTVHLVSPSVWAWRKGRLKTIRQAVDLMLPLFPFEQAFYEREGLNVECIGHPLADEYPLEPQSILSARQALGLEVTSDRCLALLPGSRRGEIQYLGPVFIDVMQRLYQRDAAYHFFIPLLNEARKQQFAQLLSPFSGQQWVQNIHLIVANSRLAMAAADTVLLASGTATLEALLLKKPMVVAYRWHPLTHAIIGAAVKVPYVSLPNLLAGRELVPELIQKDCRTDKIIRALQQVMEPLNQQVLMQAYAKIHHSLKTSAALKAATAIVNL